MTQIDEVSIQLGALGQAAKESAAHRVKTDAKLDQILLVIPVITQYGQSLSDNKEAIKKNAREIDNLKAFKNKAIGASIVGGSIAGFLASNAKYILALWVK